MSTVGVINNKLKKKKTLECLDTNRDNRMYLLTPGEMFIAYLYVNGDLS